MEFTMTIIKIQKRDPGYAQIDNRVLADQRLSWKAKGILVYLLSKPNNWKVQIGDLVKRSPDGECAVRSALDELLEIGYAERITTRGSNGKFESWNYIIHEEPLCGFPQMDNPLVDKPVVENLPLNNKELTNKELSKKEKIVPPQNLPSGMGDLSRKNGNGEWGWLRHELRPLAEAFIAAAGPAMKPAKDEHPLWHRELQKWQNAGATPPHIRQAVQRLQKDGLTIGGPQSITKTLRSVISQRQAQNEEHPVYNGG
jgi:hypothetical protein